MLSFSFKVLSKLFHFVYGFTMIYRILFFLLTFLRMRFEFLIHFSYLFKFLNTILSFYCGFVIGFVHPCLKCSSYIRFVWYFMFLLTCFTLRLEISSRFSYSIFHEYFTFCLCFCDIFGDLLTFHSLIIRFVFCFCYIFRDLLTFYSLIVRFVFLFAIFFSWTFYL